MSEKIFSTIALSPQKLVFPSISFIADQEIFPFIVIHKYDAMNFHIKYLKTMILKLYMKITILPPLE